MTPRGLGADCSASGHAHAGIRRPGLTIIPRGKQHSIRLRRPDRARTRGEATLLPTVGANFKTPRPSHSRLSGREHSVNLRHDSSTFPYRRRNTLGRVRPRVANGENAGPAGLKRQDRAGTRAHPESLIVPGDHEPFVVHRDAAIQP